MNSVRRTWVGWGFLGLAGAGGYYVTKKSVSADRSARHQSDLRREARDFQVVAKLPAAATIVAEVQSETSRVAKTESGQQGSLDAKASPDPALVKQSTEETEQRPRIKSKYEAQVPYTHRPGNRFSR